jgi:hypothetical protein
MHFGYANGVFGYFTMYILDEVLSQDMVHITDLPFLGDA